MRTWKELSSSSSWTRLCAPFDVGERRTQPRECGKHGLERRRRPDHTLITCQTVPARAVGVDAGLHGVLGA
jgi:hypothetical protein